MPELPTNDTESHVDFLTGEYNNLQTIIYEYDKAILALLSGTHSRYTLSTGQTEQSVTRLDLASLQSTRDKLMSELNSLAARLGKTRSVVNVIPGF